jgi:transposase
MLGRIRPHTPIEKQRKAMARQHLGDVRRLDRDLDRNRVEIKQAVAASGTTVTEIRGVGPVVAAFLIGYTGDITRFGTADRYASYNGTAPIEASSGPRVRHRLNRRGNRTLNHAIHMAAVSQLRYPCEGRTYYDKKQAEGKTKKEAMRALKRRISDVVYRHLTTDKQQATR